MLAQLLARTKRFLANAAFVRPLARVTVHVITQVALRAVTLLAVFALEIVCVRRLEVLVASDARLEYLAALGAREELFRLIVSLDEVDLHTLPARETLLAYFADGREALFARHLVLLQVLLRGEHLLAFETDDLVEMADGVRAQPPGRLQVPAARVADVPRVVSARV